MAAEKGRLFLMKLVTTGAGVTFTVDTANDEIDSTSHGLSAGDQIVFSQARAPAGLNEGQIYYVVASTIDAFSVAAMSGGPVIDITGNAASGCVYKVVSAVTTVAGCTSNSFTINNEIVDVTTKDEEGWRRLLDGISHKSMSINAVTRPPTTSDKAALINRILNGTIQHYQLVFQDGARLEGAFQMSTLSGEGPHDNVLDIDFTAESSGQIAHVAGS